MTRNGLLAVVVALLLVLSGCNTLQGTDTPTASPTPVPTLQPTSTQPSGATSTDTMGERTTETADPDFSPPGISPDGISAPFTVASVHGDVLRNDSYTMREFSEIRYTNGTVVTSEHITANIGPDDTRYLYRRTVIGTATALLGGGNGTIVNYANGSVVFRKTVVEGTVTGPVLVLDGDGEPASPMAVNHGANTNRIGTAFSRLSNVSVTRVNDTAVRIHATEFVPDSIRFDARPIHDVSLDSFSATITTDGFVRTYRYSFEGSLDGHPVMVTRRVRYSDVGTTTVEAPPWYDEAVENATAVTS
jgi:hypothetical protein